MSEDFPPSTFATSLIDSKLRVRAYRKWLYAFSDVFFPDESSIRSSIVVYPIGDLTVALTQSGPAHYVRDGCVVKRSSVNNFALIQLVLKGELYVNFGHKSADLSAGDIFLFDLSMNGDLWVDDCECVHLLIPRSYLHKVVRSAHGRTILRDSLVGRMLGEHFIRCGDLLRSGHCGDAFQAVQSAVDLMVQCFTDDPPSVSVDEQLSASRQNILEYIEEHLVRTDLGTDLITTEFGISRAKLYRVFAEFGGVQHFIRDRRLDAALRDICQQPRLSISEAARRYGFSNDRAFQRAFRSKFGITARDARAGWGVDHFSQRCRS